MRSSMLPYQIIRYHYNLYLNYYNNVCFFIDLNIYKYIYIYICVCVCVLVYMCVRVCVRVCMCVCVHKT